MIDFILNNQDYILTGLLAFCAGGAAALRYIAPLTENTWDDKAQSFLAKAGTWLATKLGK